MSARTATLTTAKRSVRGQVSAEEWRVRVDLAACYRLIAHYRWDDLVFTHISARVPGAERAFLLNPYGMMFQEITASSLVKVDFDGNVLIPSEYGINLAGYTIHSAVQMARPDVACVIHLHSRDGAAVSAQKDGLLPLTQTAMIARAFLAYHDYEGIALDLDERERLVEDLGDKCLMMLRNHGTLACGPSVAEAFARMFTLERACEMQVAALAGGRELTMPSEEVQQLVARQVQRNSDADRPGELAWPALLRMLDRQDPSYKD
ncbi:MAG TPA: class II aldolase/adducin family protein [Alphaproteobacteria bacterium]|nr:class II aldolase/adducin family protein [Alphaproteobacteria bacterium]